MFTTTEDEPAILHAWCEASFLGGCTADDPEALLAHATEQLRKAGLEGEKLEDAIDEIDISYAPIPDLEAGDLCVDEDVYDTDPDAEYLTATLFVKGHGPIGDVMLRNGQIWGTEQGHWAGSELIDWFTARGSDVSWHRDAILDAVADAKEAM